MKVKLADLKIGDKVKVLGFNSGSRAFVQKLLAMGFIPETEFEMIRIAPLGDPVELKTAYSTICVRRAEASEILCLERIVNELR